MKLTLLLITINVLVFIFSLQNFEYIITNYGFSIDNFLSGKYYTIITSMFLHGSFIHLFYNMLALFFLGYVAEKHSKYWQYLLVYFLSGIFGNLLVFALAYIPMFEYTSSTIAIGASAAISGIIGLGVFICPTKLVLFELIPLPFIVAGALFFIFNLSNLFLPSNIAYPAHLGGMFAGAVFGLAWGKERIKSIFLFIFIVLLIVLLPYLIKIVIG